MERCLICPKCNARSCCKLLSTTAKNRNRYFFKCPASDHKFFKWADEAQPHEFIDVPNCGGCSAGVCRFKRETSGPNAGRIMFMCRIKEGQGSCGYSVWQDELEISEAGQAKERMNRFQSGMAKCNNTSTTVTDMNEGSNQRDEGTDPVLPLVEPSDDLIYRELTSQTMAREVISHKENSNMTSKRPHKRSRNGDIVASGSPKISASILTVRLALNSMSTRHSWMADAICLNLSTELNGWWGRLVFHPMQCLTSTSSFSEHNHSPIDSTHSDARTSTRSLLGAESYSEPLVTQSKHHSVRLSGITLSPVSQNEPSSEPTTQSIMSESISDAFHQAAECLQNELITRLETMDAKDHETMSQAAEATFAALDCLHFDYEDFKKRAKELIHCASQLVEIDSHANK